MKGSAPFFEGKRDEWGSIRCEGGDEALLHQDGEHIGRRLAAALVVDGVVLLKQWSIVAEEIFHILVIHSRYGNLALRVGIVVDEVADGLTQELIANHGSDGGCTKTDLSGLVVDTYAGDLETQTQQEGSVVNLVGHHTNLVLVVANGLGVTSDVEADAVVAEVAAVDEQLVAVHHGKGFLLQHLVGGLVASPEIVVVIQALQLARLKGASLCQLFDGYPVSVDEIGITHTILCDSSLCHCCEAAEPCQY